MVFLVSGALEGDPRELVRSLEPRREGGGESAVVSGSRRGLDRRRRVVVVVEEGFFVRYGDDREVVVTLGQCGSDTFAEAEVLGVDIGGSGSGTRRRGMIVNWFGLDVEFRRQ